MVRLSIRCRRCKEVGYMALRDGVLEKWLSGGNYLVFPGLCPDCMDEILEEEDEYYGDEE